MTRSIFAASALLLASATVSQAASFDIYQQTDNAFQPTVGIHKMRPGLGNFPDGVGGNAVQHIGFGPLMLSETETGSGDPLVDFMAFCVETAVPLTTSDVAPVVYTSPASLFGFDRTQLLGTFFKNVYDDSQGRDYHGAMAMTIWKIVHGDISSPAGDAFDLSATSSFGLGTSYLDYDTDTGGSPIVGNVLETWPYMASLAASWLEALDGDGVGDWVQAPSDLAGLRFYESADSQNLVAYDPPNPAPPPVPLPAGILLLGSGLAALGLRKKLS